MNKIYKVMYSKVKQCAVVVSEIAKNHGHNGESSSVRKHAALMAAVLIALGSLSFTTGFMPMTAEAAITKTKTDGADFVGVERADGLFEDSDYANHNGQGAHGDNSITIGLKASGGDGTITIGDRRAEQSLGSVYVGRGPGMPTGKVLPDKTDDGYWATSVGYQSDATGYGSIAIGSNATANNSYDMDSTGHGITLRTTSGDGKTVVLNGKPDIQRASVAIGYGASADNGNIAIGSYSDASTDLRATTGDAAKAYLTEKTADSYVSVGKTGALRRISNVADGAADSDVATIRQLKTLSDKAGVYNEGWGIKIADEIDDNGKVTKKNAISVDRNLGNNSTSVTQVSNTGLILGGDFSGTDQPDEKYGNYGATGQYAVTLGGRSNRASGESSVAAGGMDNTAVGNRAFVGGGYQNTASGDRSSAIGGSYNTASGVLSSAIGGDLNTASGLESSAIGGDLNTASGDRSSAIGGCENTASGDESSAIGGLKNIASGWKSSAFGGADNISHSIGSSTLGGINSVVLGNYATGIAGGSTGSSADFSLAAGSNSVVTVNNGTAIGYQATTDERGTIAFGHDAGDVSGYTVTWQQKATEKDGKYYDANNNEITKEQYEALKNADLTFNDYTKTPTVKETKYDSAAYNRLVKVADGVEDHDVVVMEQLKKASGVGNNIKVYKTDENNKPIEDTSDAATTAKNGSKDAWGQALGAGTFTTGTSDKATDASTSDQLVTGSTLYDYDKPTGTQNYVKANNTTGQNLSALDAQVAANTSTLNDKTHNIKYYSVDETILPKINGYSNEDNDGAKGMGSIAAGFNTHADGIASTVAGSYSGVSNQNSAGLYDLRGATALSYGTFNINQNTDVTKEHSGVANSIIGQANATTDSNAAIIYGAGNTVTNSYRDIDTKKFDLNKVKQDIAKKDAAAVAKDLQEAVPTSGGQVMVMGGGNSVDKAYMTQVTGVGNTVTGSGTEYGTDSTQLNYIEGFYTKLENGKNDYIIGAHNTVTGDTTAQNQSNIVFGDNHKLTNTKNNLILGSSDTADDETTVSDVVSIGHNAKVSAEGGVAIGSGSVASTAAGAVGYDPTGATAGSTSAWTSKKAAVSIGTAAETRQINGLAAGTEDTDAVNVAQLKKLEGMKANVNATNIGKNLKGADGKTAASDPEKTANEKAWGTAIGTGEIAEGNGQLVTGGKVYDALHGGLTDITIGKPGTAGKDGEDGSIGLVGPKGENGKDGKTTTIIKTETGAAGVNGKDGKDGITRIVYNDTEDPANKHTVATLDDGMKFGDDFGSTAAVKLDHQLDIVGDINAGKTDGDTKATVADLSDGNIGVVATDTTYNGDGTVNTNGKLTIKLAKDLKGLHSSTYTTTEMTGEGDKKQATDYTTTIDSKGVTTQSTVTKEGKPEVVNGPSMTIDGINGGGKQITNVGDGSVAENSKDAVTGGQLYAEQKARTDADTAINNKIGALDANGNYIQKDASVSSNLSTLDTQVKTNADAISKEKQDREAAITNVTNNLNSLSDSAVQYDADTNKGKVTLAGADGTTITNLKAGEVAETSKDAVNGSQLYAEQKARTDADTAINNKIGALDANGNYIQKDASISSNLSTLDTQVKSNADSIQKNSDLIHTNTAGDTIQIGENSTATKIDVSGKDANGKTTGRVITGVVSDANDPNSAANVGYVNGVTAANTQQIYRDMNNAYGRLNNNINKAAAGSNALAALHPLDYDPDDKADFAVGYGHYRNANAAAVGAFYHPNENTMVNVGVSLGNGDPGFNAGVSFKIGSGSAGHQAMSKTEMAKVINSQSKEIDALKKDNADKDKRIDALEQKMAEILAKLDKNGK